MADKKTEGKLTIFLGAAAGVGKTRAMLDAARQRLADNIDVVVGCVETHGRPELEELLAGLPSVAADGELDVDAVIGRRPALAVIDELSHFNRPGSRHLRRFQDIEEIRRAGIDVYTTLNVQYIESLNDIVAQITGAVVRETVPDEIVEDADAVRLIDLPPEELLQRLKEGKVHLPGQHGQAVGKFLRPGNINALRELSLRVTALHVDKDLDEYMREHRIGGPWQASGRVMVCVSGSPFTAQLIRAARRLAGGLQADLLAVHVEAPARRFPMGEEERERVARNMRLAEDLGAKTLTVVGQEIADELLAVARSHNVTTIVVGKPHHSSLWKLLHGSLADDLIRRSAGINVYFIQGSEREKPVAKPAGRPAGIPWQYYLRSLGLVCAVTAGSWFVSDEVKLANVALLFQLPVILSAYWWGRWPSYFAAFLGVLCYDFVFVPPVFTFSVTDVRYLWSFLTFLVVAFFIGGRTEMLRLESAAASMRERSTRALYEFSRQIAAVIDLRTIARELVQHAAETLDRDVLVFFPENDGKLTVWADSSSRQALTPAGEEIAGWVYKNGRPAGKSTDTSPECACLFLPLKSGDLVLGVLGIAVAARPLGLEEKRLVDAWAGLAALAVERVRLAEKARQAALFEDSDRLRNALFNSVSHELRTPLASIIGSVSTLLDAGGLYNEAVKRELLETIHDGAARMERLVSNLLDTARLESGMMRPKIDWCDAEDVIGAALARLRDATRHHNVRISVTDDLPLMRADAVLIEQVLVNLLDNAVKYSPPGGDIHITARRRGDAVEFAVSDRGPGVRPEDLGQIFDKFYRGRHREAIGGTGLGLAICKGIVEAHGGEIRAERAAGGGTAFLFTVPAMDGPVLTEEGEKDVRQTE